MESAVAIYDVKEARHAPNGADDIAEVPKSKRPSGRHIVTYAACFISLSWLPRSIHMYVMTAVCYLRALDGFVEG